jgi:GINS complex subunit 1
MHVISLSAPFHVREILQDLHPPKELFIQVRVLQGVGEIMTENGTIMLEKDSQHFLRRSDVEPLIRQGILEHIPV